MVGAGVYAPSPAATRATSARRASDGRSDARLCWSRRPRTPRRRKPTRKKHRDAEPTPEETPTPEPTPRRPGRSWRASPTDAVLSEHPGRTTPAALGLRRAGQGQEAQQLARSRSSAARSPAPREGAGRWGWPAGGGDPISAASPRRSRDQGGEVRDQVLPGAASCGGGSERSNARDVEEAAGAGARGGPSGQVRNSPRVATSPSASRLRASATDVTRWPARRPLAQWRVEVAGRTR